MNIIYLCCDSLFRCWQAPLEPGGIFPVGFPGLRTASAGAVVVVDVCREEVYKLLIRRGENLTSVSLFGAKGGPAGGLAEEVGPCGVWSETTGGGGRSLRTKRPLSFLSRCGGVVFGPRNGGLPVWLGREGRNPAVRFYRATEINTGWRYSRTQSRNSPELRFCSRRVA